MRAAEWEWGAKALKKNVLLVLIVVTLAACPAMAHPNHHPAVDCAKVRAYVAQMGLEQAKAVASAAGMTMAEQRKAARCLAKRV
jgi:hypothetical protein